MLHPVLDGAFDDLLAAWRRYQERPHRLLDLATARARLDEERWRVHRLRRALHPEAAEAGEAREVVTCPVLDAQVFLYGGEEPTCVCGELAHNG